MPLFSFEGLFGTAAGRDWPRRVQETDTPHYAVAHLDGLTPGTPTALTPVLRDDPEEPRPEVVDLGSRRAGSTR